MKRTTFLAACMLLVMPATAHAACKTEDIAGLWTAYFTAGEGWFRCQARLDENGRLTGASSRCLVQSGQRPRLERVRLAVDRRCKVTGFLKVQGQRVNIDEAWMTKNGEFMGGVASGDDVGLGLHAVRVR